MINRYLTLFNVSLLFKDWCEICIKHTFYDIEHDKKR